jgi:hypothetical protein
MPAQSIAGANSTGLDAFVRYLELQVATAKREGQTSRQFIARISADCAYIRLEDINRPWRFLRQMEGAPPLRFGTEGFDPRLVDDHNPARHYMAFVFLGFWLPRPLALLALYVWEVAGFVRYGGEWSARDVACGLVGLRHGATVRRYGPAVLPELARRDLGMTA